MTTPIRLTLPATSANLGPGFDAVGLAMGLALTIEASVAPAFSIEATGRNADLCSRLKRNLILDTYSDVLTRAGHPVQPLHLKLHNEIPLGMGCGSSAAALLGGVMLASHFGGFGLTLHAAMEEACRREGHPDNVAACALGSFTVSAMVPNAAGSPDSVVAATFGGSAERALPWRLLLALPTASLATVKARALLPATYSRADAVANVQRTALLVSAFALGRGELLVTGMADRIHQPYRMEACPLLPRLLPLAGSEGVYGVALSGAGPSVLVIAAPEVPPATLIARIRQAAGDGHLEVIETRMSSGATHTILAPGDINSA